LFPRGILFHPPDRQYGVFIGFLAFLGPLSFFAVLISVLNTLGELGIHSTDSFPLFSCAWAGEGRSLISSPNCILFVGLCLESLMFLPLRVFSYTPFFSTEKTAWGRLPFSLWIFRKFLSFFVRKFPQTTVPWDGRLL